MICMYKNRVCFVGNSRLAVKVNEDVYPYEIGCPHIILFFKFIKSASGLGCSIHTHLYKNTNLCLYRHRFIRVINNDVCI